MAWDPGTKEAIILGKEVERPESERWLLEGQGAPCQLLERPEREVCVCVCVYMRVRMHKCEVTWVEKTQGPLLGRLSLTLHLKASY